MFNLLRKKDKPTVDDYGMYISAIADFFCTDVRDVGVFRTGQPQVYAAWVGHTFEPCLEYLEGLK